MSIRLIAVAIGMGVVVLGLVVHYTMGGPGADFLADALYAVLIYVIVVFFLARIRAITIAAIAYGICVLVELAQLTDGPTAVAAVFPPAVLVLGNTFALVDLVAYAVGIAVALACVALIGTLRTGRNIPTNH